MPGPTPEARFASVAPMPAAFLDTSVPFGLAHRGGTDVAPGNTIAAFDHAVALGYAYIETDVQRTVDGVLVIFHDADLESTTGVPGPVWEKTWAELAEVRVGGQHPIPRFDEVIDRYPRTRFNIEPKHDEAVEPLVAEIRARSLLDRVCVGSFSDRRVRRARRALGAGLATSPGPIGVTLIWLAAYVWPWHHSRHAALQIPRRFWIIPLTTRFLVRRYHRMGLQVHVWTINTAAEMAELFDRGVDAVMSDATAVLRQVLTDRGAWRQPEPGPDHGGEPHAC